jgi:GMP synthase (glutamine-hydrolysing)
MKQVLVFRHVPHEGLGTIEAFLKGLKVQIQYCDLSDNDKPPTSCAGIDFVISMGGPMNADETERYPFLLAERDFLANAIKSNLPTVGVCLGSQIIARALGAQVKQGPSKEIGWYSVTLTDRGMRDPIFQCLRSKTPSVFQWHGDTFELPSGAVSLATSEMYRHQAFRYRNHVYAFQFHFEVTADMVRTWIEKNQAELEGVKRYISQSQIADEIEFQTPKLEHFALQMYEPLFAPLCTQVSKT